MEENVTVGARQLNDLTRALAKAKSNHTVNGAILHSPVSVVSCDRACRLAGVTAAWSTVSCRSSCRPGRNGGSSGVVTARLLEMRQLQRLRPQLQQLQLPLRPPDGALALQHDQQPQRG